MPLLDNLREVLNEEREQKKANVHAVHIRIRCDDDAVVAQVIHAAVNIQRQVQKVQLLIALLLKERGTVHAETVGRFAAQGKDSLSLRIASRGDGPGGGITLRDEEHGILGALVLAVVMHAAITQLFSVQLGFFSTFLCHLTRNTRHLLARLLTVLDFLFNGLRHIRVAVQVVIQLPRDEINHESTDGLLARPHHIAAQLRLGLALEHGIDDLDADGRLKPAAYIRGLVILLVETLQTLDDSLAKGILVRAAHGRMLPVDKGIVILPRLLLVRDGHLDVLILEVNGRVERGVRQLLIQQIRKPVLGGRVFAVQADHEPRVQVAVIAAHTLHEFGPE